MPLLVTDAIVLHSFDYLESSRIVRLVTPDGGVRSALAKGARRSRRRFGSGLDLFAQGTASLYVKPGRDLDTLTGFEDVRGRTELAADLDRFAGAETVAEIALRFGGTGADAPLFDAIAAAFDALVVAPGADAKRTTLAGAWHIVSVLGHTPVVTRCAECGDPIPDDATALFTHSAGGVLCARCAQLSPGGRKLPGEARAAIAAWCAGGTSPALSDTSARAHQRLLREFLEYHLHDGRALRAFDLWEGAAWTAA
ncbi:MAG: DNA repair protein RecO [Gemmatimonadota bacterium]